MKVTLTTSEIINKFGFPTDTELVIEQIKTQPSEWISNIGRDKYGHPEILVPNTKIEVKFRDGATEAGTALYWHSQWKETDGTQYDIVAYRILTP